MKNCPQCIVALELPPHQTIEVSSLGKRELFLAASALFTTQPAALCSLSQVLKQASAKAPQVSTRSEIHSCKTAHKKVNVDDVYSIL